MTVKEPAVEQLREALAAFVAGPDRSREAVDRIFELLGKVSGLPWLDELTYAARKYSPDDPETGAEPFAALAETALQDWTPKKRWRLALPADVKGLRKRWTDEAGRARAEAVARSLRLRSIRRFAFGEYDGRLDFRGFVDPGDKWARRKAGDLENVDFSGATFPVLEFSGARIGNCRFDGAAFREPEFARSVISDTTFRGANLAHATFLGRSALLGGRLSPWAGRTHVLRCDFSGANLGGASAFNYARFEDCEFNGAWLVNTELYADLIRCRFSGLLDGLIVNGQDFHTHRPLTIADVDLSAARLNLVGIRGVDYRQLRLPDYPGLRVVDNWPFVFQKLKEAAEITPSNPALDLLLALCQPQYAVPPRSSQAVELDTLKREMPEGFDQMVGLLDAAEADSRGQA